MTDIVSVLNLINYGFVLIFGIIVSFYFAASDLYLYIRKAALGLVARTGLPLAVNPPL